MEELSYDAYGRRRNASDWTYIGMPSSFTFERGYTMHEHMDWFGGLINMNGRVYDSKVGRFLNADNFIQDPSSTQCYNWYSYCLNNPLKYSGPNGWLVAPKTYSSWEWDETGNMNTNWANGRGLGESIDNGGGHGSGGAGAGGNGYSSPVLPDWYTWREKHPHDPLGKMPEQFTGAGYSGVQGGHGYHGHKMTLYWTTVENNGENEEVKSYLGAGNNVKEFTFILIGMDIVGHSYTIYWGGCMSCHSPNGAYWNECAPFRSDFNTSVLSGVLAPIGSMGALTTSNGFLLGSVGFRTPISLKVGLYASENTMKFGIFNWSTIAPDALGSTNWFGRSMLQITPEFQSTLGPWSTQIIPAGTYLRIGLVGPQSGAGLGIWLQLYAPQGVKFIP